MRFGFRLIYQWITTSPRLVRQAIKFLIDLSIVLFCIYLSFLLRFEWVIPAEYDVSIWQAFFFFGIPTIVFFNLFGAYSEMWVYWSFRDLKRLLLIHFTTVGVLTTANMTLHFFPLPRSIYALYLINSTGLFTVFRMLARILMTLSFYEGKTHKNVLIVGAGHAGEMIVRQFFANQDVKYRVMGFLDDDPDKIGRRIHGVKVLGGVQMIEHVVKNSDVDEVVIAIPSATSRELRGIIKACESVKIQYRTVPGPRQLVDGRVHFDQIRKVNIEDLLGREESEMDYERTCGLIAGKRVLVTGAAGSIGSELCRQILHLNPEKLIAIDKDENKLFYLDQEIANPERFRPVVMQVQNQLKLDAIFDTYEPQLVFHAAAYKHVPCMEVFPDEAILNNVEATRVLAETAYTYNVEKFIQISTDKAVYPSNMMGVSKRLCELYVQHMTQKHNGYISVRFGNVIGSQGSVVTLFEDRIKKRQPIQVTHREMKRYFMSIREAVRLTLEAAALGEGGSIFILDMGDEIPIVELAEQMIQLAGLRPHEDIPIEFMGLRPGEKLNEQLWYAFENPEGTEHEKIRVSRPTHMKWNGMHKDISKIIHLAREYRTDEMLKRIKNLVPEFNSMTLQKCLKHRADTRVVLPSGRQHEAA